MYKQEIRRITGIIKRRNTCLTRLVRAKAPRLIYVSGWLGHNNLGDEALFDAYKYLFNRYNFIHYPTRGGRSLLALTKMLKPADGAIFAGGTLINKDRCLSCAQRCADAFTKFVVFGTGVADPTFWRHDKLSQWRNLLMTADYIGVRGPLSAQLLERSGVHNVEVIGDPTIVLSDSKPVADDSVIEKSIGLNIGIGSMWGESSVFQNEFLKLAKLARKAGWLVKWFVVWPNDLDITMALARASDTCEHIYTVYSDYVQYFHLVRSLNFFVGMKLHAVALATCAYVPSVMLEYRPKCRDYMEAIDQGEAVVRTDSFHADDVWEKVKSWSSKRSLLSMSLYESIQVIKSRQLQRATELMDKLPKVNNAHC